MKKDINEESYDKVKLNVDSFLKTINSQMDFSADLSGDSVSFDWLDQIESACPFIDNIVRHPKLTLIREENTVKIEKSKKITVDSIKDLTRHTNYIAKIEKKSGDVQPSKILDIRNEETFNIYENRFLYTLLNDLDKFLIAKEEFFKKININENRVLEYGAKTKTSTDNVSIELKISSGGLSDDDNVKKLEKNIESARLRMKRVREYLTSWQKSELSKTLDKLHVAYINPPIKKTNIILKNPNFQIASNLWIYIQNNNSKGNGDSEDILKNNKGECLKGLLDHSFLIDYFVLNSISNSKRVEKQNIKEAITYIISKEIYRMLDLLKSLNIKVTEKELLDLINSFMLKEKKERASGVNSFDVEKKFKDAINEYIEMTQDYLE